MSRHDMCLTCGGTGYLSIGAGRRKRCACTSLVYVDPAKQLAEARARIATLEEALTEAREHVAALVVKESNWRRDPAYPKWASVELDGKDFKDHQAAAAWLAERGGL